MTIPLPTDTSARNKRLVVIDGDTTYMYTVNTERAVDTLDFFGKIQTETRLVKTPVLPFGCIRYATNKTSQQYVLSFPPTTLSATWEEGTQIFNIALPFSVIIVTVRQSTIIDHVTFLLAKGPIINEEADVYATGLPNQYDDLRCCMGRAFDPIATGKDPLVKRLSQVFPYIQNSSFNQDLPVQSSYRPPETGPLILSSARGFRDLPEYIRSPIERQADHSPNKVLVACRAAWSMLNPSPDAPLKLQYASVGKLSKFLLQ